jgi:hypothetical protein
MNHFLFPIALALACILIISCDETNNVNPSEVILIEKTVSPSTSETFLSYGNEITIIVPPGAISEDIKVKVSKVKSIPASTIDNVILGKNCFRISIEGQDNFSLPIIIGINYSQQILDDNDIGINEVEGLIYKNGSWTFTEFFTDEMNKMIYFTFDTPTGKIKDTDDIILSDDGIIIIDGYTTVDSGQGDVKVFTTTKFWIYKMMNVLRDETIYDYDGNVESHRLDTVGLDPIMTIIPKGDLKWENNGFSFEYIRKDEKYDHKCNIYCKLSADGSKIELLQYKHNFISISSYSKEIESDSNIEFEIINIPFLEYAGSAYWFVLDKDITTKLTKFQGHNKVYDAVRGEKYIEEETYYSKASNYIATEGPYNHFTIYFY